MCRLWSTVHQRTFSQLQLRTHTPKMSENASGLTDCPVGSAVQDGRSSSSECQLFWLQQRLLLLRRPEVM